MTRTNQSLKRIVFAIIVLYYSVIHCSVVWAQEGTSISGKITSQKNKQPLYGATVQIKGSTNSVIADEKGEFKITTFKKLPVTLVISNAGFKESEVTVASDRFIAVELTESTLDLSDVVVVGYGTQKKTEITGSVASINQQKIADRPVQSFEQALVGKAAGVKVQIPNGVLNAPPPIRIRGTNSISLTSSPLFVVDGIPVVSGQISPETNITNNPLDNINPGDIESIDILKDAASTSIYGSRAAAGVILITTKRGRTGKARVSYNGWVSLAHAVRFPDLLNAQQYMDIKNEAVLNLKNLSGNQNNPNVAAASFFPMYTSDGKLIDTKWEDVAYHTGISQNHDLSVSGGSNQFKYFFSANYSDQQGFIRKNSFERIGLRSNLEQRVTDWFKISGGISYSRSKNVSPNSGSLPRNAQLLTGIGRLTTASSPNVPVYLEDGSYNIKGNAIGMGNNTVVSNLYNPQPLLDLDRYFSQSDHVIAHLDGEVRILNGLTFKTTYGIDYNKVENNNYENPLHGPGYPLHGAATNLLVNINNWNWTNTLNYSRSFDRHSITLLAGFEVQQFTQNQWGAVRTDAADPFYRTFEGSFGAMSPPGNYAIGQMYNYEWAFLSNFYRVTYDFSKKYFLTVNYRRDGNSVLGQDRKYGNFGGVSGGWVLSQENFYKNSGLARIIDNIKLRTSWGKVGNGNLTNRYAALNLFSSNLYGDVPTLSYAQAGNPGLGWETSDQTNIGIDLGFLSSRIQLQVSAFNNDVNNLILNAPQTASKGIPGNSIAQNVGSMYNRGLEIGLNAEIINNRRFSWVAAINYTALKNRVTSLGDDNTPIIGTTHTASETNNITAVGYSVGSLYGAKTVGINPENGRRIFVNRNGELVQYSYAVAPGEKNWTYLDGRPAAAISSADFQVLANALPTWYGGFSNNLRFDQFDLNLNFTYAGGYYVQNGTRATLLDSRFYNNSSEVLDRWTTPGQQTSVPRQIYGDVISSGNSFPISANVEKADFLRLESVSLGYTFPSQSFGKSGISSIRVYAAVFNAFLITGYKGYDPETSSNGDTNIAPSVDRNAAPQTRNYTFGVNVSF